MASFAVFKNAQQAPFSGVLTLNAGEKARIDLTDSNAVGGMKRIDWANGGLSWMACAEDGSDDVNCEVWYSLRVNSGNPTIIADRANWVQADGSPFNKPVQGSERNLIQQIFFHNKHNTKTLRVTIASNAEITRWNV